MLSQRNEGILERVHISFRVILSITSSVVDSGLFVVVELLQEDELSFENVIAKEIINFQYEHFLTYICISV